MDVLLAVLIVFGVLLSWNLARKKEEEQFAGEWIPAGRALRLTFDHFHSGGPALVGKRLGFDVVVSIQTRSEGEDAVEYTCATASLNRRLKAISLAQETGGSHLKKVVFGEDILTGDARFDDRVLVGGPAQAALAVLNQEARSRVMALVEDGRGEVEDGLVSVRLRGRVMDIATLEQLVAEVAGVASALTPRDFDFPQALARNAGADGLPQVRMRNLEKLLSAFPQSEPAREAAARALAEPDARLRLRAAMALSGSSEALPVLAALVGDPSAETGLRLDALRTLASGWPYREVSPSVAAALGSGEEPLQREALSLLGHEKDLSLYEQAVQLGSRSSDALACQLARTLGQLGDARAQRALLLLLSRSASEVKAAAAAALGEVGTVEAVEALLPLSRGLLKGGEVKEAAREAIRAIQGRIAGAGAGHVSLAATAAESGAVSLAAPAGAVSLSEAEGTAAPGGRREPAEG